MANVGTVEKAMAGQSQHCLCPCLLLVTSSWGSDVVGGTSDCAEISPPGSTVAPLDSSIAVDIPDERIDSAWHHGCTCDPSHSATAHGMCCNEWHCVCAAVCNTHISMGHSDSAWPSKLLEDNRDLANDVNPVFGKSSEADASQGRSCLFCAGTTEALPWPSACEGLAS